jgi:hypothetical protein
VSNYCLVPQETVIAKPQMLFLFLNHNLNSPTLEIMANDFFHRHICIIGYKCKNARIVSSLRKNNFDFTKLIHRSHSHGKFVSTGLFEPFDVIPSVLSSENILAIITDFVPSGIDFKPSIGLADADITPFSSFAGIGNLRAKIERVKQNGNIEFSRYISFVNKLGSQSGEFLKRDIQFICMLFFDIKERTQWNRYTSVEKACLEDCMSVAVFAAGVVMDFTHGIHFFGPLDRLGIIDNEHAVVDIFLVEFFERVKSERRNNFCFVEIASGHKFAMICPVSTVSQEIDKPFDGAAVTDTDSNNQRAKIVINVSRKTIFNRLEKRTCYCRDFTDSKHNASLHINYCINSNYTQKATCLFAVFYHKNSINRSV